MTVLTVGETMALLDPVEEGELRLGMALTLRFAGAESNFAVALARLGVDVAWVSRLGRDPFAGHIALNQPTHQKPPEAISRNARPIG